LDKLHAGLSKRGIVSTGTALSLALANQAGFAAPAGLAASVAAAALSGAGSTAGGTALGVVATFMSTLKIPLSVTALIVVTATAVLITQSRARDRLQAEITSLGQASQLNEQLRQQNKTLAAEAAEVASLRSDDAELNRLRDEVDAVRARQQEVDRAVAAAQQQNTQVKGPIYDLKNLDQVPRATRQPQPEYPPELKEQGIKGEATIGFIVTEKGELVNAYVISTPRPEFGEAALKAIKQWQFEPGKKAGQAANVRMLQPFTFGGSQPAGLQLLATPWF
jgi:TonB family protein